VDWPAACRVVDLRGKEIDLDIVVVLAPGHEHHYHLRIHGSRTDGGRAVKHVVGQRSPFSHSAPSSFVYLSIATVLRHASRESPSTAWAGPDEMGQE
jgi:hypothetical protein